MNFQDHVVDWILDLSRLVASENRVGWVATAIMVSLIILGCWFSWSNAQKIRAVKRLISAVDNESEFAEICDQIEGKLPNKNKYDKRVKETWKKYDETLLKPDDETDDKTAQKQVRNTVRPNFFFNTYDLGFNQNIWRYVPGIFVSVGLFLTFLGIIAAINGLKTFDDEAMRIFLDAAKSKFIMSLSGLFASIVFTIWYRLCSVMLENRITRLCEAIEHLVLFHGSERVADEAAEQLKAIKNVLDRLGNDLGAQIGEKIADKSATAVKDFIEESIKPVLETVGNAAGTEVGSMITGISDALNAKLNESLHEMSDTLSTINKTLVDVTNRLQSSGSSIGEEMSKALKNLNTMLETSHETQEKDLEVMNNAVTSIAGATQNLRDTIIDAGAKARDTTSGVLSDIGAEVKQQVADTGVEITKKLAGVSSDFFDKIMAFQSKLDVSLVEPIKIMAASLEVSNKELEKHAAALKGARASHEQSTVSITNTTKSLENVSRPLAESIARVERINSVIRAGPQN